MQSTPLVLGPDEFRALRALRALANEHPVDITTLEARLANAKEKAAHREQMTAQSIPIPTAYMVTFSIETGHPLGTYRHMSLSVARAGRVPNQDAVWMIAVQLGYTGQLSDCVAWLEELEGHGEAVNLVQLIMPETEAHA